MRLLKFVSSFLIFTLILSSCKTSNDVVSNGVFQKRKYRSGFHLNLKNNQKTEIAKSEAPKQKPQSNIQDPQNPKEIIGEDLAQENLNPGDSYTANTENENVLNHFPSAIEKALEQNKIKTKAIKEAADQWEKTQFKSGSKIKKRSALAFTLTLFGSILFIVLAINFFAAFLPYVLLLTLIEIALLLGGLLLSWKHKDTNGLSRTAFILSWVFLGLTALFYFSMVLLGLFLA